MWMVYLNKSKYNSDTYYLSVIDKNIFNLRDTKIITTQYVKVKSVYELNDFSNINASWNYTKPAYCV